MFTQFVNYIQKNVGTTAVTLVTCPASNQLVINQLSCANITGLTVTCSVTVTRAGTVVFIVNNATVPAGGSLICAGDDQKIVLMAGDVVQVRSSLANSIDAVISGVLNDFNRGAVVPAPPTSPVATFLITPSTTSTFEGNTVTYSVTTTNVPNGTVLYWQNFGTTTALDFTDDRNDGEFVITGGAGSFTRTLRNTGIGGDPSGELPETIQIALQFRPGYLGGGAVAGAATVTVSRDVVTSGLVLNLDAANPTSYPGFGTTWFNLSGSANNGTLTNGPSFNTVNGGAIAFDGVNDFMQANVNTTTLDGDPSFTVDMFVRRRTGTNIGGNAGFWGIGGQLQGNSVSGWTPSANLIHLDVYDSTRLATSQSYPEGQFVHISWTKDGSGVETSNVKCYINGVEVALTKTRNATRPNQFNTSLNGVGVCLGRINADSTSFHAPVDVGSFKVYNRALSDSEVQQNFNALRARHGL